MSRPECSVKNCEGVSHAKVLCWKHYLRWIRKGTLELSTIEPQKHNKYKTKTYNSWDNMKQRCYNPKRKEYANYGGRGIEVCESWRNSFVSFFEDMGERPDGYTLDRIDVNGNYEPGNCRWVDWKTQATNKRKKELINA